MASGYRGVFLIGNKAANRITDVQVVDAGGNTIPLPFAEYVARGAEPNYKTLREKQAQRSQGPSLAVSNRGAAPTTAASRATGATSRGREVEPGWAAR